MSVRNSIKNAQENVRKWTLENYLSLAVYNVVLVLLFSLRSAGYFDPIFPLTINSIIMISLVLGIFILGARRKAMFIITLTFWILAGLCKIFLKIDVWAERAAIYAFESLILAICLLIWENVRRNFKFRKS